MMLFLRTLLIFFLIYSLLKWFGALISRTAGRRGKPGGGKRQAPKSDYSDITDQKVEDADFEEL
ncbi:MAG TPA: hypothetical protein VLA34_11935 [Candidatus Krumholzibacterium sp.]|nr:hypothetical protein [Candidatus Krumholzibacterium sp.]